MLKPWPKFIGENSGEAFSTEALAEKVNAEIFPPFPSFIPHPPSPIHAYNPATDTMIGFYAILQIHQYLTHKNLIRL